jgi:hypothetical protein
MNQVTNGAVNAALDAASEAKELVQKGITTANVTGATYTDDRLVLPQDLSPLLTNLDNREASFFNAVKKTAGVGDAAVFNLKKDIYSGSRDPVNYLYAEAGLPTESTTVYDHFTNPYKDMGVKRSISGRAKRQARGGAPSDLRAEEVQSGMMELRDAIDWASFWLRTDATSTAGVAGYAGVDQLISTNIIDAGGSAISKAIIDEAIRKIIYQRGTPAAGFMIWCSPGVGIDLDNTYNTKEQININLGSTEGLTLGNTVVTARTRLGDMPIMHNYNINPGLDRPQGNPYSASSAASGLQTSTVFILPMKRMEYRELLPMSMVDLAIVADKEDFMIIESGTLVLTAEPHAAKITNVHENVGD